MNTEMKCDYFGCEKPQLPEQAEVQAESGMKFCTEHDAEFHAIATAEPCDPMALLQFWVKANGGAKRLADSMCGGIHE